MFRQANKSNTYIVLFRIEKREELRKNEYRNQYKHAELLKQQQNSSKVLSEEEEKKEYIENGMCER